MNPTQTNPGQTKFNQEDILRKIARLMAIANRKEGNNGVSNEAEANAAMAKVQQMLADYNLDMAMIQDTPSGATASTAKEVRQKTKISRSAKLQWQRDLWRAIAEANFCWYYVTECYEGKRGVGTTSSKPVKRHLILGREVNVIAVRLMGEYLEDCIENLLPYPNHERMSRSAQSWKLGCAQRLAERVKEQAAERLRSNDKAKTDAPSTSTAVALRTVYETEFAGNYDAEHGEGAWARKLARDAAWEAGRAARIAEYEKESEERTAAQALALANETEKEKAARLKREEKAKQREDRWEEKWNRQQQQKASKIDRNAYWSGQETGGNISLATQVASSKDKERLG